MLLLPPAFESDAGGVEWLVELDLDRGLAEAGEGVGLPVAALESSFKRCPIPPTPPLVFSAFGVGLCTFTFKCLGLDSFSLLAEAGEATLLPVYDCDWRL